MYDAVFNSFHHVRIQDFKQNIGLSSYLSDIWLSIKSPNMTEKIQNIAKNTPQKFINMEDKVLQHGSSKQGFCSSRNFHVDNPQYFQTTQTGNTFKINYVLLCKYVLLCRIHA